MNITTVRSSTVMDDISTGRIVWAELPHAQKVKLVDRAVLTREQPGMDYMTSVTCLNSVITNNRNPASYLYMLFARTIEVRGLEQVAREIEQAENNLPLATCFIEMFGIEKAHLLGRSLSNKVKGTLLEDQLGL
jgi:hypothetical protein